MAANAVGVRPDPIRLGSSRAKVHEHVDPRAIVVMPSGPPLLPTNVPHAASSFSAPVSCVWIGPWTDT
jgi:hypothetical protein